ncbi:3-methyl-2-oxobutanoate hydroxymethyltransferase [Denitrobaculum tricleocarpae]|uniref:3-methyl-2-oxobutanoate hydroxymethyltransferase n=1 Tax=Denitrobaculum tricleocarpae TaxID=2591009 RepID=A0A545U1G2_9PROT|nr:3-methyl-2-oxobutanoate hydroxymethyltransferase [Denitrobaculum tricleocarpae]
MPLSAQKPAKAATIQEIRARKNQTPIVALTAYTTPISRLLDPHVDVLLVGDSLGMVIYGMETTLGVTLEMMCAHGKAVVRGAVSSCVVVDMPFGSYQESQELAYRNAARILAETGCAAVKLEGGQEMAATIAFLTARGIPVMGHVGLLPQSFNSQGGFRTQGRTAEAATRILADARAVADAGAFSIVVEGVVETLAAEITNAVVVPTIGIGASAACDGQILVTEDLLGLFSDFTPKFVKRYAELGSEVSVAVGAYAKEVRARSFPASEHCFGAAPQAKRTEETTESDDVV